MVHIIGSSVLGVIVGGYRVCFAIPAKGHNWTLAFLHVLSLFL